MVQLQTVHSLLHPPPFPRADRDLPAARAPRQGTLRAPVRGTRRDRRSGRARHRDGKAGALRAGDRRREQHPDHLFDGDPEQRLEDGGTLRHRADRFDLQSVRGSARGRNGARRISRSRAPRWVPLGQHPFPVG